MCFCICVCYYVCSCEFVCSVFNSLCMFSSHCLSAIHYWLESLFLCVCVAGAPQRAHPLQEHHRLCNLQGGVQAGAAGVFDSCTWHVMSCLMIISRSSACSPILICYLIEPSSCFLTANSYSPGLALVRTCVSHVMHKIF